MSDFILALAVILMFASIWLMVTVIGAEFASQPLAVRTRA